MSGLWSVITLKCGRPARNVLHFRVAQVTASSSSSMTAYRDSGSVRKRYPAWIRVQVLSAVLLQNEAEALPAGICAQAGGLARIKKGECWCCHEGFLGSGKCQIMVSGPDEVVFRAQEGTEWS